MSPYLLDYSLSPFPIADAAWNEINAIPALHSTAWASIMLDLVTQVQSKANGPWPNVFAQSGDFAGAFMNGSAVVCTKLDALLHIKSSVEQLVDTVWVPFGDRHLIYGRLLHNTTGLIRSVTLDTPTKKLTLSYEVLVVGNCLLLQ